jgi:hypothetical protein
MAFFKKWLSSFAKPKEVAEETIQEELGKSTNVVIKYKKNYFDEVIIRAFIQDNLRIEYPMVALDENRISFNRESNLNRVQLVIDCSYKSFVNQELLIEHIKTKLLSEFKENFEVELVFLENVAPQTTEKQDTTFDFYSSSTEDFEVELETIEPFIGELIEFFPRLEEAFFKTIWRITMPKDV